jgi:dolichol-phosphate mannosyltransferase
VGIHIGDGRPRALTHGAYVPPLGTEVGFVVPALNEACNLPRLFDDLERCAAARDANTVVYVVDDGSTDGTAELAEAYHGPLRVEVVRHVRNLGPGAAFDNGFRRLLSCGTKDALVVTLEADNTSDLDRLAHMIERAREDADLVLASARLVNVRFARRALSTGASAFVRSTLGVNARTVSNFFRVYRLAILREAYARFGDAFITEPGFACKAEILAKLERLGARIAEVPVDLDWSRREGRSKMPVLRTTVAYGRLALRGVREPAKDPSL